MENPSIILAFLLLIVTTLLIWKKSKTPTKNLPPGPWKLPIIGNMHQLFSSLPHRRLAHLAKKYGPVMHLQLGQVSTIVVSSPEAAKQVMQTHDINFANRPHRLGTEIMFYNGANIAFSPYGKHWRQLRKVCTLELFSAKRVQSFRPIREEEVSKLVKSIYSSAGNPINLSTLSLSLAISILSRTSFGRICEGHDAIFTVFTNISKEMAGFYLTDFFPSVKSLHLISRVKSRLEKLHQEADQMVTYIINEYRAARTLEAKSSTGSCYEDDEKKSEDLIGVLLKIQDQGDLEVPLSIDSVKAVIQDMFLGGTETTGRTVEWVISELVRNPEAMEKTQTEVRQVFGKKLGVVKEADLHQLTYLKLVIKETLRLYPPGPLLLPRENKEKCEINGYNIPAHTQILVNAWALGRDPKYWVDAEKFMPERFMDGSIDYKGENFEFIPFGGGRRICPGILFAIANLELVIAQLLYHFDWKLPNGLNPEDLDMTEDFGVVVKRKTDLILIPIPYVF